MPTRALRLPSIFFASLAVLVGCSDDGTGSTGTGGGTSTTSTSTSQGGGANAGGGGGSQGGATQGGGGQGGAAQGGGGAGSGGAKPFGPCHDVVENFDAFVLDTPIDAWDVDADIDLSNGADKALVTIPDADGYAGLYSATPKIAENCFFDVAVEGPQSPGGYVIELLEQGDTGRKVIIEVIGDQAGVGNIINAQGDGDALGMATLNGDLRGLRIQVLDNQLVFEVKDMGGWHQAATMSPPPTWITSPVLLSFGYRSDGMDDAKFDDVNVETPQ